MDEKIKEGIKQGKETARMEIHVICAPNVSHKNCEKEFLLCDLNRKDYNDFFDELFCPNCGNTFFKIYDISDKLTKKT